MGGGVSIRERKRGGRAWAGAAKAQAEGDSVFALYCIGNCRSGNLEKSAETKSNPPGLGRAWARGADLQPLPCSAPGTLARPRSQGPESPRPGPRGPVVTLGRRVPPCWAPDGVPSSHAGCVELLGSVGATSSVQAPEARGTPRLGPSAPRPRPRSRLGAGSQVPLLDLRLGRVHCPGDGRGLTRGAEAARTGLDHWPAEPAARPAGPARPGL